MNTWMRFAIVCAVLSAFVSGCEDVAEENELTGRAEQRLTLLTSDDFDAYADTDDLDGKSGGTGWNSDWETVSGSVAVSDDQSHTGSLSIKFGATSNDVVSRTFTYTNGDMAEVYIYAPASLDAMANFELRSEWWSTMFLARFNYLTAGNVSVYDQDQSSWYDIASFNANAWNKLGYRVDPDTGMVDVYVNDEMAVSGLRLMDDWSTIGRIVLESGTANGAVLYMDSPQSVTPNFETFDTYSDTQSLSGLSGGVGWSSDWSVSSGTVTVSDDQAQSGSLSLKFGATSSAVATRDFSLDAGELFEIYVYAPSSLDAMGSVELRKGTSAMYLARFNYLTAGQLSVYDQDVMSWSNVGSFNANAWNKLGYRIDPADNKLDVYLNDSLVASDVGGIDSYTNVDRLDLESSTANGAVLYMDSPRVVMP